ncbi:hypothetical protein EJB05_01523, partial [Eragrostis curvula]
MGDGDATPYTGMCYSRPMETVLSSAIVNSPRADDAQLQSDQIESALFYDQLKRQLLQGAGKDTKSNNDTCMDLFLESAKDYILLVQGLFTMAKGLITTRHKHHTGVPLRTVALHYNYCNGRRKRLHSNRQTCGQAEPYSSSPLAWKSNSGSSSE